MQQTRNRRRRERERGRESTPGVGPTLEEVEKEAGRPGTFINIFTWETILSCRAMVAGSVAVM
jgi:hypothetical protein